MDFVLIISILIMCYISYRYNTFDTFKNSFINFLVQILHIATLVFILFNSIMHGSFLVWIFCFFAGNALINSLLKCFLDIINALFPDMNQSKKSVNPSPKKEEPEENKKKEVDELTVDNKKEER